MYFISILFAIFFSLFSGDTSGCIVIDKSGKLNGFYTTLKGVFVKQRALYINLFNHLPNTFEILKNHKGNLIFPLKDNLIMLRR